MPLGASRRRAVARLAVVAVLGAGALGARADAQTVDGMPDIVGGAPRTISPGVVVFEVTRTDPPLQGRVARIAPEVVRDRLAVVVSNDAVAEADGPRRETTTSMCLRYRCVVGVNADQWYTSGDDPSTPIGGTVVGGELWRTPEPDPNEFTSMGQLQFDANGTPDARQAPPGWTVSIEDADGTPFELVVNRIPLEGEITLYTHRLGARTPVDPNIVEWAVSIGDVREGATTVTPASGTLFGGGTPLAPGTAVLAARSGMADQVAGLLYDGTTVHVDLLGARWAVGGFPVLMENGEYTIFPDDPANAERDARTVAGWTAGGELLLVTVDNRPGWSGGASVVEAARLLRTLGAVEAINLDGGGSTTMVEGGRIANRPADGTTEPVPRSVVDALVVIPPEGLDFALAVARTPSQACPDGQVPTADFEDLDGAATHRAAIACVAWKGITGGIAPRVYAPTADVSRAQMATFLERLLFNAGESVPSDAPDAFGDDEGSVHEAAINRLAAIGMVTGIGGGRYDPQGAVTRAQMATFLARAVYLARDGLTPPEHDYFVDDSINVHEWSINVTAELGIAGGTAPDVYNPAGRVSRGQMASFLSRALDASM